MTLQVKATLLASSGVDSTLSWLYVQCTADEFTVASGHDTVECVPCPSGADCSGSAGQLSLVDAGNSSDSVLGNTSSGAFPLSSSDSLLESGMVEGVGRLGVIAQPGFWAADTVEDLNFYTCPVYDACLRGGNGSRSRCATGYTGILCGVCSPGYFQRVRGY